MLNKFKFHLLIIWIVFVFILTLMPVPEIHGTIETYYDKVAHVFLFGIFSYLFYLNLSLSVLKKVILSIGVGISFSLLVEFLQLFVPGRDASHLDFLAGLFGILIFTFLSSWGSER